MTDRAGMTDPTERIILRIEVKVEIVVEVAILPLDVRNLTSVQQMLDVEHRAAV